MDNKSKQSKLKQVSRNYVAQAAKAKTNAGYMKHKNERRANSARKSWKNEQW